MNIRTAFTKQWTEAMPGGRHPTPTQFQDCKYRWLSVLLDCSAVDHLGSQSVLRERNCCDTVKWISLAMESNSRWPTVPAKKIMYFCCCKMLSWSTKSFILHTFLRKYTENIPTDKVIDIPQEARVLKPRATIRLYSSHLTLITHWPTAKHIRFYDRYEFHDIKVQKQQNTGV